MPWERWRWTRRRAPSPGTGELGERGGRRRAGRAGGQSTMEMAFCLPLFLLALLGTVDAALWSVQTSAAVSGAELAARLAASAALRPDTETTPDSALVFGHVAPGLRSAMFGTAVREWDAPCPGSPDDVWARFGSPTVVVCAEPVSGTGGSPMVRVRVIGYAASLVPPAFGLHWRAGAIPVSVGAETHRLVFAP